MGTAIVVILILLAVGVVVGPLLRLRNWLQKAPPFPADVSEPPDDDT
ncbi:MAG: hypothetical protein WA415_07105 [Mycobacterium sp.]